MTANAKDWALAAAIVAGGFALVRIVCMLTCALFG